MPRAFQKRVQGCPSSLPQLTLTYSGLPSLTLLPYESLIRVQVTLLFRYRAQPRFLGNRTGILLGAARYSRSQVTSACRQGAKYFAPQRRASTTTPHELLRLRQSRLLDYQLWVKLFTGADKGPAFLLVLVIAEGCRGRMLLADLRLFVLAGFGDYE